MEFAPLFLLILISPADSASESTAAIQAALYQELGSVSIAVAADTPEARAPWKRKDGKVNSRYFSRVVWVKPHQATIQIWEGNGSDSEITPKVTRNITFAESDSMREQGRSIGLVIAHILQESGETTVSASSNMVSISPATSRNAINASMDFLTYRSSDVAIGPSLHANVDVRDYLWVHGFAYVLQGFVHGYSEFGFGTGVSWPVLSAIGSRYFIGPRLEAGLHREAVALKSEHSSSNKVWSVSFEALLWGTANIWRSLQIVAGIGARAQTSILKYKTEEEDSNGHEIDVRHESSRYRFHASLGLGLSY